MTPRNRTRTGRLVTGCIAVAVFAGLAATNYVLAHRATRIFNERILPRAGQKLGLGIDLQAARVQPWRGRMQIEGLRIANPPPFEPPDLARLESVHLHLRPIPLLWGAIDVTSLTVTNARIAIIRNAEGTVNLAAAGARRDADRTDRTDRTARAAAASRTGPDDGHAPRRDDSRKATLRHMSATTVISYLDAAIPGGPLHLALVVAIEGRGLTATPGQPWGELTVQGHLETDPEAFVTDLQARVAPLTTPDRASFDVAGTIKTIRLTDLGAEQRGWDVQCTAADLSLTIACRDGVFLENSKLSLRLLDPRLTGQLANKARHMPMPEEVSVHVPLRGTLLEPELDVQTALMETLLDNLAGSLGTLLESTTIDGKKLDGDLGEATRKLGEILKNWK